MTDAQRKEFQENLNKYFEQLKQEIEGKTVEDPKKMDLWFKNLFGRYNYALSEDKKHYGLPKENLEKLIQKLNEMNITEEEYINAKGRRKNLIEILKQKQEEIVEVYTLEELKKIQEENDKKITELMKKNEEQQDTIQELEEQIKKYETNKTTLREEYSNKYEKRLEEKLTEVKEKYEETLEIEKNRIKLEYQRRINNKQNQIDELQEQLISQNKRKKTKEKIIKEQQKEIIIKLLCTNSDIKIDTIKNELEYRNLNTENIREILKELKTEIPGLNKKINEEGKEFTYSLNKDAKRELDEYKTWNICPTITTQENGTFSFIVRSDIHLNMNNSEDTIKKIFSPYLDFSTSQGNIPIIDLGDLADTRRPFTQQDWEKGSKEAIKYAYNFYKNYAKTINSANDIKHYTLFGNHDAHPYLAGVDPLEIIYEYSKNFNLLGISEGAFKIGQDKIGTFHDKPFGNIVPFKEEHNKEKRDEIIYDNLSENMKEIAKDYIYSLIGHYHFGAHNPQEQFSVINNGIENSLLFTAEIKDGQIEKMYVTELYLINNIVKKSGYQTEIYNKQKIIKK